MLVNLYQNPRQQILVASAIALAAVVTTMPATSQETACTLDEALADDLTNTLVLSGNFSSCDGITVWLQDTATSPMEPNPIKLKLFRKGDTSLLADLSGVVLDSTVAQPVLVKCNEVSCQNVVTYPEEPEPILLAPVAKTGQTVTKAAGDDGDLEKGVAWPSPRFTINVNPDNDNGDGEGMPDDGICNGTEVCNGTVTDNLTGLIWLTKANCIKTDNPGFDHDSSYDDGRVNWQHALDFVAGVNAGFYYCGDTSKGGTYQTDWRLPNIKEMRSLADYNYTGPALSNTAGTGKWVEGDPFSGVGPGFGYWSSTTYGPYSGFAWYLENNYGAVGWQNKSHPSLVYYVWPVRGGQ